MVGFFFPMIIYDVNTDQKQASSRKPIFSSQSYFESRCAFCDVCFAIVDPALELYYVCQSCDDFVACLACIQDPKHRLITHSPDHLFAPIKPHLEKYWFYRNLSITCDICKVKHFPGRRYRCRHCCNYNVCSNCLDEAKRTHFPSEEHIFDFIPNTTRIRSNRSLLARRAIQVLRHRNAGPSERDPITGWTIEEATLIAEQSLNLFWASSRLAKTLLTDEEMNAAPATIEDEDSAKLLVSLK